MSSDDSSDAERLIQIGNYVLLIPSILTIITCPLLFFKYARKGWKRTGFSMIFLLILSDFLYSLIILGTVFYPYLDLDRAYRFGIYFCSNFSIYWACAIAFLIYRTLTSKDPLNINKLFIKTLCVVVALTLICGSLMNDRFHKPQLLNILAHIPLFCGVFLALIFYLKSIKFLKSQSEFEQGSINIYIKSLQYYCLTQFALYLPSIIFILGVSKIGTIDDPTIEFPLSIVAEGLASLSGFVNTIIFLKQGNIKEYQTPPQEQLLDSSSDVEFLNDP